jgi:hypothetical protein
MTKEQRVPRFRREHGTWPLTGYWAHRYAARINRHPPFRHRNSCWSVIDPKRECDCGAVQAVMRRHIADLGQIIARAEQHVSAEVLYGD